MIEESNKMILDVKQKLVKAIGELRDVMVREIYMYMLLLLDQRNKKTYMNLEISGRKTRCGGYGRIQKCWGDIEEEGGGGGVIVCVQGALELKLW